MSINKFSIILGSSNALLFSRSGVSSGDVRPLRISRNDRSSWQVALNALRKEPNVPFSLVIDSSGMVIRAEKLPQLNKSDRIALTQRRVANYFPDSSLRWSFMLDNNHSLLAAARQESISAYFLKSLSKLPNPCQDLRLAPLEITNIARSLVPATRRGWTLCLSSCHIANNYAIRQVSLCNGIPVMTTLLNAPMTFSAPMAMATLALDIDATRVWLMRMGWGVEMPLRLVCIMPPKWQTAVKALGFAEEYTHVFTPNMAAQKLGNEWVPHIDESCADGLIASLRKPLLSEDQYSVFYKQQAADMNIDTLKAA